MTPELRTELSRVFAAESVADTVKDDGEEHGIRHPPEERNRLKLIAIELANAHHAKKSVRELYEGASTLPDAKAFLVSRGFPEMAQYLCDVVLPNMPPITRPNECRTKAILCETGSTPGCQAYREKDPQTVAKALRWLAEVCERGMVQAALDWEKRNARLDRQEADMLRPKHDSTIHRSTDNRRNRGKKGRKPANP